eukprot:TRINITY_DN26102_c0_g1_i1.p2 TRINITY_DN26102_c0_g1~~TRINITY_DN26102_c0_g1_i1.p2  ORF type:complete len:553 (+),score=135.27 TRINITY_DN26102_c0_g1_i1:118-1659(+)
MPLPPNLRAPARLCAAGLVAAGLLLLSGVLRPDRPPDEDLAPSGSAARLSPPAALGAALAHAGAAETPPLPPSPPPAAPPGQHMPRLPPLPPPPERAANATCFDADEMPADPNRICRFAIGSAGALPAYSSGQDPKWTLVVTTYKGHKTLRNTLQTWAHSGLLHHPHLAETVWHVNKCTCADVDVIRGTIAALAPALPVRVLCTSANRIHPQALLMAIGSVRTPFTMLSENDRPTLPRTGETPAELRARIGGVLDLSLQTAAREETPFVLIHRFFLQSRDIKAYKEYRELLARGVNATLAPEVTRPHQHMDQPWRDPAQCWIKCADAALAAGDPEKRKAYDEACKETMRKGQPFCDRAVCQEWIFWQSADGGTGAVSGSDPGYREMMCAPVWMQLLGAPAWYKEKRLRYTNWDPQKPLAPFVYCTKSAHWVNAPQIFRTKWYLQDLVGFMCRNRKNIYASGLIFKPKKKYFGHYGRAMEDFNIKYRAGLVVCHADGITDHVELEDYFFTGRVS